MDGLKGYAACTWAADVLFRAFGVSMDHVLTERVVAGIVAVLGHNFTCWLRFKGGKGIATTAGVYFALAPVSVSIALATWIVLLIATRYVSIASIVAAAVLATAVWLRQSSVPLGIVTTCICGLAIWKHKGNIARLKAGTENRIVFGRKRTEGGKT